jgi:hypothetical protein
MASNATHVPGEWVTVPESLILADPIGTGKSHLAFALGPEATKQKRRVLFSRTRPISRGTCSRRATPVHSRAGSSGSASVSSIVDEGEFGPTSDARDE